MLPAFIVAFSLSLQPVPRLEAQKIATTADFRGLCAVNHQVAWVSGTKGTVGRTIDGGNTWEVIVVPGAEKLDFRDIEAFSDSVATVLSIGPGENSRIYKTTDGGKSWKLQFMSVHPDAFFDAIAFWDEQHGLAMSDPMKGSFKLLSTEDGGTAWKPIATDKMPAAQDKEGAFAASGTCLVAHGKSDAWLVTGSAAKARVFHSTDRGATWTVTETPILAGLPSAGIFSIAFNHDQVGMIVGGDYLKPKETNRTLARTQDGGKSWQVIDAKLPFCSCIVWAKERWIAAGTAGSHVSVDGKSWTHLDRENYNVISVAPDGTAWLAGPRGRIARYSR